MGFRIIIETSEELVEILENKAQEARASIGKTRTKLESNEMKGQVAAFNEAIFYVKEYIKTQKEMKDGAASQVESVDSASYPNSTGTLRSSDQPDSLKVKA